MPVTVKDFNYGARLKMLVDNSGHTVTQFANRLGYSDRASVYDLFKKEWIKRDVLLKALAAIGSTEDEFFGLADESKVTESKPEYSSKKVYIEDQISELYRLMDQMNKKIIKLEKSLSHE